MTKKLNYLYWAGWLLIIFQWAFVSFNKLTYNSLGLYEIWNGKYSEFWSYMLCIYICLLPALTFILFFRLFKWSAVRILEVIFALLAWILFLYNASFIRS